MNFLLLFVLTVLLVLIVGAIWTHLAQASLREMNAGARLYQEKRYAEAEHHFQQLLIKRLPPGVEADTRRRLADTLDILGRSSEATEEREHISSVIAHSPRDAKAQQARGDLLKRKYQYDEACEAYMKALAGTPHSNKPGRAAIMARLALANYDAGRPDETIRWAACSLASLPNPSTRRSMERMSGVSYSGQGDLEKAEEHYQNALSLSELSGNPKEIAEDLGVLAAVHYKHGQFVEAIAACHQARQVFDAPSRASYVIEAECLREIGRFDEARIVMTKCGLLTGLDQPWAERRMQAIYALSSASIETRADQPEAALVFLDQAREGLIGIPSNSDAWPPAPQKGDDRLLLWCDATKTLALAQRGDFIASRLLSESVLTRLPFFADDRVTQLGTYSNTGRAAFILGDLVECQKLFGLYLDCQPGPVGLPPAHYWLGETYLRLAETGAAREAFRQAVAPGIDSLEARKAQARLNEMGG